METLKLADKIYLVVLTWRILAAEVKPDCWSESYNVLNKQIQFTQSSLLRDLNFTFSIGCFVKRYNECNTLFMVLWYGVFYFPFNELDIFVHM